MLLTAFNQILRCNVPPPLSHLDTIHHLYLNLITLIITTASHNHSHSFHHPLPIIHCNPHIDSLSDPNYNPPIPILDPNHLHRFNYFVKSPHHFHSHLLHRLGLL